MQGEKNVAGEYSVSLLQELLTQRTQWNKEKQDLVHQLEIVTEQVCYCSKYLMKTHSQTMSNDLNLCLPTHDIHV